MTPIQTNKSSIEVFDYRLVLTGEGAVGDSILTAAVVSEGSVAAVTIATAPGYYQYGISGGVVDTISLLRIVIGTALGRVHEIEHSVRVVS